MTRTIVVGSGPNGLAAAITLAQAGQPVLVLEGQPTFGGGIRSEELTLPGFVHDVCAAIHPMFMGSPFFRSLPLDQFGLQMIQPPAPLAHPFDDGTAATLERSVAATAHGLGEDGPAYEGLMLPLVEDAERLFGEILGPLRMPRHPFSLLRFGVQAMLPASIVARRSFRGERARALFAGMAGHSLLPMERPPSAAFGLVLGMLGHQVGWPIARGGSQRIADALVSYLRSLGGELRTDQHVSSLSDLPAEATTLLDVSVRSVLDIAGSRLPPRYTRVLRRYRYGPGSFKVDWALDAPIPWRAAACARSATVHLGGSLEEIERSERAAWSGEHARQPLVILAQQSLFDSTRAPMEKHTAWAYCHVPHGSTVDMTQAIEDQVERFAPGFRQRIIGRATRNTREMEQHNPNIVGGDINGGAMDLGQLWSRPSARVVPYSTPDPRVFVCSSATPPGGGAHGMCGHLAARAALRRLR